MMRPQRTDNTAHAVPSSNRRNTTLSTFNEQTTNHIMCPQTTDNKLHDMPQRTDNKSHDVPSGNRQQFTLCVLKEQTTNNMMYH